MILVAIRITSGIPDSALSKSSPYITDFLLCVAFIKSFSFASHELLFWGREDNVKYYHVAIHLYELHVIFAVWIFTSDSREVEMSFRRDVQ